MPAPSSKCQHPEAWPASTYGHLREGYLRIKSSFNFYKGLNVVFVSLSVAANSHFYKEYWIRAKHPWSDIPYHIVPSIQCSVEGNYFPRLQFSPATGHQLVWSRLMMLWTAILKPRTWFLFMEPVMICISPIVFFGYFTAQSGLEHKF